MALSDFQKVRIIRHLGFSGKSLVQGTLHFKSQLAAALEDLDQFTEAALIQIADRIEKIDERLDCAYDRLSAIRVDEIQLRDDEIEKLRNEKMRLIRELGRLIDVAPQFGGRSIGVCV